MEIKRKSIYNGKDIIPSINMTDKEATGGIVELKFPSHMEYLGVSTFYNFFKSLAFIEGNFLKEDLANLDTFPMKNINSIGRALSYLRYLGFVDEQRDRQAKQQIWVLTQKSLQLKDALHFQEDKYPLLLRNAIKDTPLYNFISNQENIVKYNKLKKSMLNQAILKHPALKTKLDHEKVKLAGKFLLEFFERAGNIVRVDSDVISLVKEASDMPEPQSEEDTSQPEGKGEELPKGSEEPEEHDKDVFKSHISNQYTLYIYDEFDQDGLDHLNATLKLVEKKRIGSKDEKKKQKETPVA